MRPSFDLLKKTYRTLVPAFVRRSRTARRFAKYASTLFSHDYVYDNSYYENHVDGPAAKSADAMTTTILDTFKPGSVVDVGCGTGYLLMTLKNKGIDVFGLEYAEAGLEFCRRRGLDVRKFDLENDQFADARHFDVAVSVEVAEHLPAKIAEPYVDLLTRLADRIVFTAAPPGQGGRDHVNEQPAEYWIDKFAARSFVLDDTTSQSWRDQWKRAGVQDWYYKNLMLFRRA